MDGRDFPAGDPEPGLGIDEFVFFESIRHPDAQTKGGPAVDLLRSLQRDGRSFSSIIGKRPVDREAVPSGRGGFAHGAKYDPRVLVILPRAAVVTFGEIRNGFGGVADQFVVRAHFCHGRTRQNVIAFPIFAANHQRLELLQFLWAPNRLDIVIDDFVDGGFG